MDKEAALYKFLQQYQKPAIAFSGGVDSSVVLAACRKAGVEAQPIMCLAEMIPQFEREDALRVAKETASELELLIMQPLELPEFVANGAKRCYYCKKMLMTAIQSKAKALNCDVILDGGNLDDHNDYRPGLQAVRELGIVSPLSACGFNKDDVRKLAGKYGLSVANKPAYACLASRIAYGEAITKAKLERVERAEDYLRGLGLHNLRVRSHGDLARIEVQPEEIALAASVYAEQIHSKLKGLGFKFVTLDLQGYTTGSMNAALSREK